MCYLFDRLVIDMFLLCFIGFALASLFCFHIGLQNALCKFEGRSHTPDKYMEDLKMAAEVATTTRTDLAHGACRRLDSFSGRLWAG